MPTCRSPGQFVQEFVQLKVYKNQCIKHNIKQKYIFHKQIMPLKNDGIQNAKNS